MPAFIKTPKDEARWKSAKEAADKVLSEADGDNYWALTNFIYHKMSKSEQDLEKATKLSDEYDPNSADDDVSDEPDLSELGLNQEESDGEDWLKENDPSKQKGDDYEEYAEGEDEDAHRSSIEEDFGSDSQDEESASEKAIAGQSGRSAKGPQATLKPQNPAKEVEGKQDRFPQPSDDELMELRAYTLPWERRAREKAALEAQPEVNPIRAQQGDIIEARNIHHKDFNEAHEEFINSPEFKAANALERMRMTRQFKQNWHEKNPNNLVAALAAHHDAHAKGAEHKQKHKEAKAAKIEHIIQGGAQGGQVFSNEEGMQHAGGVQGEEGTRAAVAQDPAAAFAMGNQAFIKEFGEKWKNKFKDVDISTYEEAPTSTPKRDINSILGSIDKNPKFEAFFNKYYPIIRDSMSSVRNKLGLNPNHPEKDLHEGLMHEAGMHGIIQAINNYNPEKDTSFATHVRNTVRNLQLTAMGQIDAIPLSIRNAQKEFNKRQQLGAQKQPPAESKVKTMLAQSPHPKAPDITDRLKRVDAQRQAQVVRRAGGGARQAAQAMQPQTPPPPKALPKHEFIEPRPIMEQALGSNEEDEE